MRKARAGLTRVDLTVVVVAVLLVVSFTVPGLVQAQSAAQRVQSINNLKQIGLAGHVYHDANGSFPPHNDANGFSAFAYLLPFIEQDNLAKKIDFKKPATDKANAEARKAIVKVYVSPGDPQKAVSDEFGPTNYQFCAGSKPELKGNDGVFAAGNKTKLSGITNGTSNTLMAAETLKGDGGKKAVDVKRQHIALKKDDLGKLKDDSGVAEWKEGKYVVGDRCASWLDGRFLQTSFTGTRLPNATEPDVDCEGLGGLSSLRSLDGRTNLLYCDGHISSVNKKVDMKVWKAICNMRNTEAVVAP